MTPVQHQFTAAGHRDIATIMVHVVSMIVASGGEKGDAGNAILPGLAVSAIDEGSQLVCRPVGQIADGERGAGSGVREAEVA